MVDNVILKIMETVIGCLFPIIVIFGLKGLPFLLVNLKRTRQELVTEKLLKSAMNHLGMKIKRSITGSWNMFLIKDKRQIILLENHHCLRHTLFKKPMFRFIFFPNGASNTDHKVMAIKNVFKGMTDEEILMYLDLNTGIEPAPIQIIF